MSVISNHHTAVVYEPKGQNKTQAMHGQRLVVTIAKADKYGNYGEHLQQTMATSIPQLAASDIEWTDSRIQNACVEYFKTVQNSIVSDRIKVGQKTVDSEELDSGAILRYLDAEKSGDKWDSERIANWFNDSLASEIYAAQVGKGIAEDVAEKNMLAYGKLFADTFSSKAAISTQKAQTLQKALKLVQGDSIAQRFQARIDKVLQVSLVEDLGL